MTWQGMVFLVLMFGFIGAVFIVDRLLFARDKSGFDVQHIYQTEHSRQALTCPTDRGTIMFHHGLLFVVLTGPSTLFGLLLIVLFDNHVYVGSFFLGVGMVVGGVQLRSLWNYWGATLTLDTNGIRWQAPFNSWFVPWETIGLDEDSDEYAVIARYDPWTRYDSWTSSELSSNNVSKSIQILQLVILVKDPEAVEHTGWRRKVKFTCRDQPSWYQKVLLRTRQELRARRLLEKGSPGSALGTFEAKYLDISPDELETTVRHFLAHPDDRARIESISSVEALKDSIV